MSNFYLKVKSSIDKMAHDIASSLAITAVELDDITNVQDELASPADLVLFSIDDMQPAPADPLYVLRFQIGVKTTQDSGNYDLSTLLSVVQEEVALGDTFYLRDYSTVSMPTEDMAFMYVTDVQTEPQEFDGLAGIRMQRVFARIVRYL